VVLGRRPNHRRTADVDLLHERIECDARLLRRRRERIQIHHDEVEWLDRRRGQLLAM